MSKDQPRDDMPPVGKLMEEVLQNIPKVSDRWHWYDTAKLPYAKNMTPRELVESGRVDVLETIAAACLGLTYL